jgi:hypothetical protein
VKLAERSGTLYLEVGVDWMLEVQFMGMMVSTKIATADIVAIAHNLQHFLT